MDTFEDVQARIDEILSADTNSQSSTDRIFAYAKRGVDEPKSLSPQEIQQVCYALLVHYAQMGRG